MSARRRAVLMLLVAAALQRCATSRHAAVPEGPQVIRGNASWYGQEFAGRATANGEIFDPLQMTAAHRTLPFGTIVEVRNVANGSTVRVRINDRGPFVGDRVIDLSYGAAQVIGLIGPGVGPVEITVLGTQAAASPLPAPVLDAPPPQIDIPIPPEPSAVQVEPLPPEPAAIRGYFVQLGAFADRSNAERLRARIAPDFPAVRIESAGAMHRVRLGPFSTRDEALGMRTALEDAGYSGVVMFAD